MPRLVTSLVAALTSLAALGAAACGSSTTPSGDPPATTTSEVALDREFELAPGRSARLPSLDLNVRFDSVENDSRCPRDVACVWSGNAEVVLTVRRGAAAARQVVLNTSLEPRSVTEGGATLTLVRLTPETHSEQRIPAEAYRVVLTASNAGR